MSYKERNKLLKCSMEDLSELEKAEMEMYATMEVDSLIARLGNYSKDFKYIVALQFLKRVS